MTKTEARLNAMFEELVPMEGPAASEAGEIVRAICRIGYRWKNDGDRIGVGYGRETCNPAARYLEAKCPDEVARRLTNAWERAEWVDDDLYDRDLAAVEEAVLDYLEATPELTYHENKEDFWDYRDPEEDQDTYDEEDDEMWI